jgi:Ni,Fe-hydrogenase III large subunit
MFVRLFQRLVEQIIEGDIDQVRGIIARPGIQAELRSSFTDLLQVIEQLKQANESYMNDISFYRTIIKRIEKGGDIPKQELIEREDISPDKL